MKNRIFKFEEPIACKRKKMMLVAECYGLIPPTVTIQHHLLTACHLFSDAKLLRLKWTQMWRKYEKYKNVIADREKFIKLIWVGILKI